MKFALLEQLKIDYSPDTPLLAFIEGKSYDQIKTELEGEPFNINVRDRGNLYICKYSQIDSDFTYKIVRECRGIILEKGTNKVVCFPFSKFFNLSEPNADKVDFATASVQEKVDGSIIKVYNYNDKWQIATNGTIDAHTAETTDLLTGKKYNFYDLFHDGLEEQGVIFPDLTKVLNPEFTYIFELVHPITRIVVKYEKPGVYLIGIRNNKTGKEIDTFDEKNEQVAKVVALGIKQPKIFSLATPEEIIAAANELSADQEGFVVRDSEFRRVKIKSPLYLKMHYLKANGELTLKHFVEMIQANETAEFLSAFPEYTGKVDEIRGKIQKYVDKLILDWKDLYSAFGPEFVSRKQFAEFAKKTTLPSAMFRMLDLFGKGSKDVGKEIDKYVMEMMPEKVVAVLEV